MIEHEYVTLKLVNGDNIIGLMVDEDENRFVIMYPIQMKTVRIAMDGSSKEIIAGSPWCSFTDHEVFQIWKTDVIIIKPLNDSTIEYYKRMVDAAEVNYYPEDEDYEEQEETVKSFGDEAFFIPGNTKIH